MTGQSLCKNGVNLLMLTKYSCVPVSPLLKDLKRVKIDCMHLSQKNKTIPRCLANMTKPFIYLLYFFLSSIYTLC